MCYGAAGMSRRRFLYAFDLLELDGADMRRESGGHPAADPAWQ